MLEGSALLRETGSGELVQHNRCNQPGGADDAQQLQQGEGLTGCGGDLLRIHGAVLKSRKKRNGTRVDVRRISIGANPRVSDAIIAARTA